MIEPEQIIYLDNNATTQLDPRVVEEMLPFLAKYYGNGSSGYGFGRQVRDAIDLARERVATLIGCTPAEIVFTSGGTESNNAALSSALQLHPQRRHIVTTAVEHSATRRYCEHLATNGHAVTFIGVNEDGALNLDEFASAIRPETAIVSIMWANNETGVLFPIDQLAKIARARRTLSHTDAIQAAGKIPITVDDYPINFLSLSAHKIHGPKGVGALYINRHTAFRPSLFGGGQESGRRAGTENIASIVGFGKAAQCAAVALADEAVRVRAMRDRFEAETLSTISGATVNGDRTHRLPNTTSISFAGIEADAALLMLDRHNVCCSAGSACRSASLEPSHVLLAMGLSREQARSTLRFSFSRFNTPQDTETASRTVEQVVTRLREIAPC